MASEQPDGRRKKKNTPENCHPLVCEFVELANKHGKSWNEIAFKGGLHPDTARFWAQNCRDPHLTHFTAALGTMGYTLAIVPMEQKAEADDAKA